MTLENVLTEVDRILTDVLPDEIKKINEKYNDGILLRDFTGNTITKDNCSLPYLKVTCSSCEITEKDRILRNEVYSLKIEIMAAQQNEMWQIYSRYGEAIENAMNGENDVWNSTELSFIKSNAVEYRVKVAK